MSFIEEILKRYLMDIDEIFDGLFFFFGSVHLSEHHIRCEVLGLPTAKALSL